MKIERQSNRIQFALTSSESCCWLANCHLNFCGNLWTGSYLKPHRRQSHERWKSLFIETPPAFRHSRPHPTPIRTELKLNDGVPRSVLKLQPPATVRRLFVGSWPGRNGSGRNEWYASAKQGTASLSQALLVAKLLIQHGVENSFTNGIESEIPSKILQFLQRTSLGLLEY